MNNDRVMARVESSSGGNKPPDSIDIVSLIYPDGLVEFEQKEIENIRTNKARSEEHTSELQSH